MDIFEFRNQLVKDYSAYVKSFINIRNKEIKDHVWQRFEEGILWPEPLIQLNPSFEPGKWIDELVTEETLHKECSRIFRIGKLEQDTEGKPFRLHRHQSEAIYTAKSGNNYVLTTGTGSGKSLAYIVPIVNHVLQNGSGKGIQAIVVYPMNALANSQFGELEKFLCHGYSKGNPPVTFKCYTGQEKGQIRDQIIANPPDILLTNYVMLELILTRPYEKKLVQAAQGLRFLVLDELHTYRGRQGADVALLVRRVRNAVNSKNLQCVGTSATLAGIGTYDEQRKEVAEVASQLFGSEVKAENVIGETLRRATAARDYNAPQFIKELTERITSANSSLPKDYNTFIKDPLSNWIESTFGVSKEKESGRLIRSKPCSIQGDDGAATKLSKLIGVSTGECTKAIQSGLLAGYQCDPDPDTGLKPFAFRLHQFISRGDTVYSSLEDPDKRHITMQGQQFVPGDRDRVLLPMVFCRECGQEYYSVRLTRNSETNLRMVTPRSLTDQYDSEEGNEAGFLYYNPNDPWSTKIDELISNNKLPETLLEDYRGVMRVRTNKQKDLPLLIQLNTDGTEIKNGIDFHYLKSPFHFCLQCGVSYNSHQTSDFGKLTTLGLEGRSTATTILSLSTIRNLKSATTLRKEAQKLLSFTDNRQDASLQAGHFNDFVEIGLLRSALYKAVNKAGSQGLTHEEIAQKVFEALALPLKLYTAAENPRFQALAEIQKALRNVLGYRIYRDLKRGWRVTSPNLEQCGLLTIDYLSLNDLCEAEDIWERSHPLLAKANPATRKTIAKALLDYMRRELVIKVDYLHNESQEKIQQQSSQHLIAPWAIDENEKMEYAPILFPRSSQKDDERSFIYLSPRGGFGLYLRRRLDFTKIKANNGVIEETKKVILDLLENLRIAGLVVVVAEPRKDKEDDVPGYQLPASVMVWLAGDGKRAFYDPIRVPKESSEGGRTNPFFVEFYQTVAHTLQGLEAREHTAQVPYDLRTEREQMFREAELPILYCSPTMELGVDISDLNVVNLRNIPPTPANYAQRSGRAGRSGQPALVFSYCSTGSPHDQYFFKRPDQMVAGAVTPPRLDLANEDLVRAHIQAIWLAETGLNLGNSLKELLQVAGEKPSLALQTQVLEHVEAERPRQLALTRAQQVLETIKTDLNQSDWHSERWLEDTINQIGRKFDETCQRWRGLYNAALEQRETQNRIIGDASRSQEDKKQAKNLRREAEAQLDLLTQSDDLWQSDFYSYRYFASEGFLPGYNFPRLPISAYIPARRTKNRDEFLSRPRFLAISEFGPRAIVYHEGSRYVINKVILAVEDGDLLTKKAKLCPNCGYLHPILIGDGVDRCERCNTLISKSLNPLFRLQNVSTKRRDKISSDEEERVRLGYEIRTAIRFSEHSGQASYRVATIEHNGQEIGRFTYGQAATLWRINLGWRRRTDKDKYGFVLDQERGYWESEKNESSNSGQDTDADNLSQRVIRVIPYVEDRRNSLIFEPTNIKDDAVMASLQSALKTAIQVFYQLEENELAAEPLPERSGRSQILFYESAEGGAGVLRRLLDDPKAFSKVAKEALRICHFDPETAEDKRKAPRAQEECEAACYDCLMSYSNQMEHKLLDRKLIKDFLFDYTQATVKAAPVEKTRSEHLRELKKYCGSNLESQWLDFLEERGLRLPSKAQAYVEVCKTKPDFLYEKEQLAIYIDGPHHEHPDRHKRDTFQTDCMEDRGYIVVRFSLQNDWLKIIEKYPSIFGQPQVLKTKTSLTPQGSTLNTSSVDLDLDLFDKSWHPLLKSLSEQGFTIEAGSDVTKNGRVIGSYLAEVSRNGKLLRLLDQEDSNLNAVKEVLEEQGISIVMVKPETVVIEIIKLF